LNYRALFKFDVPTTFVSSGSTLILTSRRLFDDINPQVHGLPK